ncbi:hypothetical protein [Corynebacterium lizhenjunii]|uniref:hypothetical protein n=1 Tax=Corynebacterium lizhenjunii TaxID=2709394 RepID=UPI0013E9C6B3|nr:hypothetical protein [Corynebacterium lizhenjunii]
MLNFNLVDFILNLLFPLLVTFFVSFPLLAATKSRGGTAALRRVKKVCAVAFLCALAPPAMWLSWNPTTSPMETLTQMAPGEYPDWQIAACVVTLCLACGSLGVRLINSNTELVLSSLMAGLGFAVAFTLGTGFPEVTSQDGIGQLLCFIGVGAGAFVINLGVWVVRSYIWKWRQQRSRGPAR